MITQETDADLGVGQGRGGKVEGMGSCGLRRQQALEMFPICIILLE